MNLRTAVLSVYHQDQFSPLLYIFMGIKTRAGTLQTRLNRAFPKDRSLSQTWNCVTFL